MEYPIKKVVMTGGTSGIGIALVNYLLKNNIEVWILRRRKTDRIMELPRNDLLHVVYCSLEELHDYIPKRSDYDVFFHLGWANTAKELRNDITAHMKNVEYSCAAVELAKRCGCHTFIGVGSQAEYGRHNEPLKPDTLCRPENAYGVAKLSACHATRLLCDGKGIRHIWLRVLSGYGLYDGPYSVLISTILKGLSGEQLQFSEGKQIWDFIHFDDIATALFLLAKRGKNNSVYVVGSGKKIMLKDYLRVVCEKLGRLDDMELGIIPYSTNAIMHLEADISDLVADTGWKPYVSFEDGIESIILFYKKNRKYLEKGLNALNQSEK